MAFQPVTAETEPVVRSTKSTIIAAPGFSVPSVPNAGLTLIVIWQLSPISPRLNSYQEICPAAPATA
jgi:hypothetical protein